MRPPTIDDGETITTASTAACADNARGRSPGLEGLVAALVQASPTGMLLLDHAGRIALANVEAERLFGYARDELLGRSVETLLPEPYRNAHVRQRAAFLVERTARRMGGGREIRALRKDGHEFSAEIGLARIDTPGRRLHSGHAD